MFVKSPQGTIWYPLITPILYSFDFIVNVSGNVNEVSWKSFLTQLKLNW
jgi:hypothetical protein